MKTNQFLNAMAFCAWITGAAFITTACDTKAPESSNGTAADSQQQAEKENDVKFENKKQEKDAQFLVEATAFNLEEIQLGELVRQKSNSADVQGLAKMMVEEHQKTLKEVQAMAKTKLVTIPDTITA